MISVFQIFRVIIGVVIFVFVLTFFLRISELYSGTQAQGEKIELVKAFDQTAMNVYTSGNPATFQGFHGFDVLVYEPPQLKSDPGHHTMNAPTFFLADRGEVMMDRECMDMGWYSWCAVFAFPSSAKVVFNPTENTAQSRELMLRIAEAMPESLEYGYCNGTEAKTAGRAGFLDYVSQSAGKSFEPCSADLPSECTLVTVGVPSAFAGSAGKRVVIHPSAGMAYSENITGGLDALPFSGTFDALVLVTGGVKALSYKEEAFAREAGAAAGIMRQRTILVSQKTRSINREPCAECVTPIPKECGYTDSDGRPHESEAYKRFISSLSDLIGALEAGDYAAQAEAASLRYAELVDRGCE